MGNIFHVFVTYGIHELCVNSWHFKTELDLREVGAVCAQEMGLPHALAPLPNKLCLL